ncbi:MAG: magnesium/cobalt transporter CorA [Chloroflexota bacterium]
MSRLMKGRSGKAGLPPGSLVHIGRRKKGEVKVTLIEYDETQFQRTEIGNVDECPLWRGRKAVTWVDVEGIHDIGTLEELGKCFSLHPLVLEDILNTTQRPKFEDYGEYHYIVLKMLTADPRGVSSEQVSILLGGDFVVSFQEGIDGDLFQPVRERLQSEKGRMRRTGPDYLAYSLIDAIVDHYFTILEGLGEKVEDLEQDLVLEPTTETLQTIQYLKREMLTLRRSVWPLREVIGSLERDDSPLISEQTKLYLRDVYDHTVQIIDSIETLREMLSGMLDIYLSSVSNRLNSVMKVLTIIATIFMPLTFLAGVYGMNFRHMPELEWSWGYPAVLLLMLAVALSMVMYFKTKKWW